ncbi:MAG TPA: hypothetical protein VIX86_14230 [Streptosporangiaceae bacterium]
MAAPLPDSCQELLDRQHGVIARWQAAQARLDAAAIDARLRRHRWQPVYTGVYAAFTGELPRLALLWAAVLRAGPGAVLSYSTAAELDHLIDRPSDAIHVTTARTRRVTVGPADRMSPASIVVHYSSRIDEARHPSRVPPRTRIEETTVDLSQAARTLEDAESWLIRACSRRLTTPHLLAAALAARTRLRWRTELTGALADIDEGVHSALESRYVRRVERPHGLPPAVRQAPSKSGPRNRYLDNHYREFGVVVELDGRAAHPAEARWRDIHRDNASAAQGLTTLRYGWADLTTDSCRVAREIGQVLRQRGWAGRLRACGPSCALDSLIWKDFQSL